MVIVILSCLLCIGASARSSGYLSAYSADVSAASGGEIIVGVTVDGLGYMTQIGASSITIYKSSDQITWNPVKTYSYTNYPSMFYKPDYLIVQTENPVSGVSEPQQISGRTTKPDTENHGYGLRNIEFLAQKHNGFMKTARENGVFKADVALLTEPGQSTDNTPSSL